jgi:hypothetical protein
VLPRPGAWPTVLPIGLRRRISSQSNDVGCLWPAAMRSKRSGRRPAGLRDPRANSEVVAETGGGQTSREPRLGCGWLTCSSLSLFSRTSSAVRRKNPAISANDIPRSSESFKKNRSALAHGLPMSFMTTPWYRYHRLSAPKRRNLRIPPITSRATPHNLLRNLSASTQLTPQRAACGARS